MRRKMLEKFQRLEREMASSEVENNAVDDLFSERTIKSEIDL
jgi:hypothetical protein